MIYFWAVIFIIVFNSAGITAIKRMRERIREKIIQTTLKTEGSEAAKAKKSHLDGEW